MAVHLMCVDVVVNYALLALVIIAKEAENTLKSLKKIEKFLKKFKKCLTIPLPHDIIDSESEGNNMKEKIYEAIKKSGKNGIRLRDLGFYLNVWHVNLLDDCLDLVKEGKIYAKTIGHGWQAYIKYYVTES
ncbi:MAG: hypothetical protein J6R32_06700 [Bacteroidales bacterium]|nr:hypothetical protein [Bacteroidales bacterium]